MASSSTVKLESDAVSDRFLENVDVWQTIFKMLSVKDRIRLEMTNKRFRVLMLACWKRVTSFDNMKFDREMSYYDWELLVAGNRWAAFVSICVNRIGDGLRSLTLREEEDTMCPVDFRSDTLRPNLCSIGEACPNIETINFIFSPFGFPTLGIHFDSFSRLKTLTVSIEGEFSTWASASVFLSIPTSIELIRGLAVGPTAEPFENAAQMEGFFAHRPSLREVYLPGLCTCDESKADIFRVIAERCPHLKSIKLSHTSSDFIDYNGVVALESMKELRLLGVYFDEMDIVTICERSPLVEALELWLRFSPNLHLQSAALNALGALTQLCELRLYTDMHGNVPAPSLVTEFVGKLARNSGASLRHLDLPNQMPLPTVAIEALANGCPKLRYVKFYVRVGEAEPASIRLLIDSIVAHPSWIPETGEPTLVIHITVRRDGGGVYIAGLAAFKALAEPAANLPSGVRLSTC